MYTENLRVEIAHRIERIQNEMRIAGADALLLSTNANLYYSSGRVYGGYTYVPATGDAIYFVRRPVGLKNGNVVYIHKPEQIPALLAERGISHPSCLALEQDLASYGECIRLSALFPDATVVNGSPVMRRVRAVKSPYEVKLLKISAAHHAEAYRRIRSVYQEGMSDIELQIEIERLLRLSGCLGLFRIGGSSMETFTGTLLCGTNADIPSPYDFAMGGAGLDPALPMGANGSIIKPGMSVLVDLCGNFTGYMTDMTRIFRVGELPELAYRAHRCSIDIHRAFRETAKPGVAASELYRMAADMAKEAGLEEYFMGHAQKAGFVGHGVGIEINEAPVLAPRSRDVLVSGHVIALEPKFVIPQVGGVGIEDTYLITDTGVEQLTEYPEEIAELY